MKYGWTVGLLAGWIAATAAGGCRGASWRSDPQRNNPAEYAPWYSGPEQPVGESPTRPVPPRKD